MDKKIEAVAKCVGIQDWKNLKACILFESGGNPKAVNPYSKATGLIQFMPQTAAALGTSIEQLSRMSAEKQLDYVEKYFYPWRGKLKTLEDIYMAILWPRAVGKPSTYVLFEKADAKYPKRYLQNKGLDWNKDGFITKAEAAAKVRKIRATL